MKDYLVRGYKAEPLPYQREVKVLRILVVLLLAAIIALVSFGIGRLKRLQLEVSSRAPIDAVIEYSYQLRRTVNLMCFYEKKYKKLEFLASEAFFQVRDGKSAEYVRNTLEQAMAIIPIDYNYKIDYYSEREDIDLIDQIYSMR